VSEKGLNVTLDRATVQEFEQLLASCRKDLEQLGYKV
jgi:hypothetical protein